MRVSAIVPARMGSARFPGKPLADVAGRPMFARAFDAAARAALVFQTFVSSPDREILEKAAALGIPTITTSKECRNGTERVLEAMRQLAARDENEIVVNVQGDEPAIRPETIDELVREFEDPEVKVASVMRKFFPGEDRSSHNRVKVMSDRDRNAIFFSRTMGVAQCWELYRLHVGVYAYRREVLPALVKLPTRGDLEQSAWMVAGYKVRMVEIEYQTASVDVPEDLSEAVRAVPPPA